MNPRLLFAPTLGVILLLACGCSFESVDLTKQAVDRFHARLNGGQADEIYGQATDDYRNAMAPDLHSRFINGIRKKLGTTGDWSTTNWRVNVTTSGKFVVLVCNTKFANGMAEESFTWRISGGVTRLVGYRINSPALIAE